MCAAAVSAAVLPGDLFECEIPACADGLGIIVLDLTNEDAVEFVRQSRHPRDVIRTASGARWRHTPTKVCVFTHDPLRRNVFAARAKNLNGQMLVL